MHYDNRQLTERLRGGTLSKATRRTILIVVAILLSALSVPAAHVFRDAQEAARGSAKYALLEEMAAQLDAWPEDKDYPASLVELELTYPDGGDESLLKEIEYRTTGRTCSVRVTPFQKDIYKEFSKRSNADN